MNEQLEHIANFLTCGAGRIGPWCLWGRSLADFVCNRRFTESVVVTFPGMSYADVRMSAERAGVSVFEATGRFLLGVQGNPVRVIQTDARMAPHLQAPPGRRGDSGITSSGFWRENISAQYGYYVNLPWEYGACLDAWHPRWWEKINRYPVAVDQIFFGPKRKRNGYELLAKMYECGERAGIREAMFVGFGTALGVGMAGDFIPGDRDMDMCIMADRITADQEQAYLRELERAHMFEKRRRGPTRRQDNGRFMWLSLGPKSVEHDHGVKSCNWFFFEHAGFLWHTKGGMWVSPRKFNQERIQFGPGDHAVCLGIEANVCRRLVWTKLGGVDVQVPAQLGTCCDRWYPGWSWYKGGASRHINVMRVRRWGNKRSWRII